MPDDLTQYWTAFKSAIDAIRTATEIWKNTRGDDAPSPELEAALETAFTAAEQATALLAVKLDFKLCKCTFPGTPMTFVRHDPTTGQEIVKCPKCDTEYPPELEPIRPQISGPTWGT